MLNLFNYTKKILGINMEIQDHNIVQQARSIVSFINMHVSDNMYKVALLYNHFCSLATHCLIVHKHIIIVLGLTRHNAMHSRSIINTSTLVYGNPIKHYCIVTIFIWLTHYTKFHYYNNTYINAQERASLLHWFVPF